MFLLNSFWTIWANELLYIKNNNVRAAKCKEQATQLLGYKCLFHFICILLESHVLKGPAL